MTSHVPAPVTAGSADAVPRWIAVDWGTTNLRAWLLDGRDRVRHEAASGRGMSTLRPEEFEDALLALVGPWLDAGAAPVPVVACGMVGARSGWIEAPYARVPCPPSGVDAAVVASTRDPRLRVRVLAGLSQAAPPDVMRGEETQLAGLIAREPDLDGTVCLPGTHTKWARVAGGRVRAFRTCMSGELFALLGTASVLRHSVAPDGWNAEAYAAALPRALEDPGALPASLFALRADALLADADPIRARARLSALLIGAELAAMRSWWEGAEVVLVGAAAPTDRYRVALEAGGGTSRALDADTLTLAGLAAARRRLFPDPPIPRPTGAPP